MTEGMREGTRRVMHSFKWILLYVPLAFAAFELYSFTVRNCQYEQNFFFGSVHSSGQISEPLGGLESLKGASKQQEDAFSVFA